MGSSLHQITTSEQRTTPLQFASEKNNKKIVKQLLDNGAEINGQNDAGNTALHFASAGGHLDTVKLLLDEGADANLANDQKVTSLDLARQNGHDACVEVLLAKGAKVNKPSSHVPEANADDKFKEIIVSSIKKIASQKEDFDILFANQLGVTIGEDYRLWLKAGNRQTRIELKIGYVIETWRLHLGSEATIQTMCDQLRRLEDCKNLVEVLVQTFHLPKEANVQGKTIPILPICKASLPCLMSTLPTI